MLLIDCRLSLDGDILKKKGSISYSNLFVANLFVYLVQFVDATEHMLVWCHQGYICNHSCITKQLHIKMQFSNKCCCRKAQHACIIAFKKIPRLHGFHTINTKTGKNGAVTKGQFTNIQIMVKIVFQLVLPNNTSGLSQAI